MTWRSGILTEPEHIKIERRSRCDGCQEPQREKGVCVCVVLVGKRGQWAGDRLERGKASQGGKTQGKGKTGSVKGGAGGKGNDRGGKSPVQQALEGYCNECRKWIHMVKVRLTTAAMVSVASAK